MAKLDVGHNGVAINGLQNGAYGVEGYVVEKRLQGSGIKLPAIQPYHDVVGHAGGVGLFVGAHTGKGIIYISYRYQSGEAAYLTAPKSPGIAFPIYVLVMFGGYGGQRTGPGKPVLHLHDSQSPIARVLLDGVEFHLRQSSGLVQKIMGSVNLADIMQHGSHGEDLQILLAEALQHA